MNTIQREISIVLKGGLYNISFINRYSDSLAAILRINPKNGYQRVVQGRDSIKHLEVFINGQWIHVTKCGEFTNKNV